MVNIIIYQLAKSGNDVFLVDERITTVGIGVMMENKIIGEEKTTIPSAVALEQHISVLTMSVIVLNKCIKQLEEKLENEENVSNGF